MAIFTLTTQLKLLQGFTSNPELLRTVVEGKKGIPGPSVAMNNAVTGDQPGADDPMLDAIANDPGATEVMADMQQFEAEQQAFQIQLRQQYTLDALNELGRYLSMMPGRKNLIWFSGSFPLNILPDPDLKDPLANVESAQSEFRETAGMLSRSQVAVYPIDARGLMTQSILDASQNGSTMMRQSNGPGTTYIKMFQNTANEHGTMQQMAEATGGRAYFNTNGLTEAVEKAVAAGSDYYTLAYAPTNRELDGSYRRIEVKIDRPGVSLAYRHGYFADDLKKITRARANQKDATSPAQYDALRSAMQYGAPDPTQLIFVADVRPVGNTTETNPAPGNQTAKNLPGPFRRYAITFIARPTQVGCDAGADGVHHCGVELVTVVYNGNGKALNLQTNSLNFAIPSDKYAEAMNRTLAFRQEISVPIKGEYFLRIGMRDEASDRVGAVELSVAAVAKLPPVPSVAAPSPSAAAAK